MNNICPVFSCLNSKKLAIHLANNDPDLGMSCASFIPVTARAMPVRTKRVCVGLLYRIPECLLEYFTRVKHLGREFSSCSRACISTVPPFSQLSSATAPLFYWPGVWRGRSPTVWESRSQNVSWALGSFSFFPFSPSSKTLSFPKGTSWAKLYQSHLRRSA